jgi:crotonobetainyl-CoA:carnitine CoA-transferase CaiB-like acyl-CoA transferase
MGRLELPYTRLAESNPALIMLSISGFGADGPESHRAAYAPIVHAETGIMARQAQIYGQAPADMALSIADTNAGLHGLVAVLAALHLRHRTGRGQHIDMAMMDATLVTDDHAHVALDTSYELKNMASEVWESAAGPIIIAGDFRYLWRQLTSVMGVADPTPPGAELEEKIAIRRAAAQAFLLDTCSDRAAVIDAMARMNLAWGDVRTSAGAHESPTVLHRRSFGRVDDRGGGTRGITESPYRFSAAESRVRAGAPHQGEHNAAVLADWLEADAERIAGWSDALFAPEPAAEGLD